MVYLPTLGETWPHSRGNVGKYSIPYMDPMGLRHGFLRLKGGRNPPGISALTATFCMNGITKFVAVG